MVDSRIDSIGERKEIGFGRKKPVEFEKMEFVSEPKSN